MKKFFGKGELRLLWPFYFAPLVLGIFAIYAIFQIPYFRGIGLSMTEIGFLISAMALAAFIFEIPTGVVADVAGRKFSTILGILLSGAILICAFFTTNFYVLLSLFFLLGIAATFVSGAQDAWIVDLLKHNKKKNLIQSYYSKSYGFSAVGFLVAGFVGAFLVGKFGLRIIWPVTGVALLLNALIFLFAKEHFVKESYNIKVKIKQSLRYSKKSIKYSLRHKALLMISISSFILILVGAFAGLLAWYPLLQNLGFRNSWFGYLYSVSSALAIAAPVLIRPLIRKFGGYKRYIIILMAASLLVLISVISINLLFLAVLVFLVATFLEDMTSPAKSTFFQSFVPSKMRASVTSFREMWVDLGAIISAPLAGFLVDNLGPKYAIFVGGILIIPAIILYSRIKKENP